MSRSRPMLRMLKSRSETLASGLPLDLTLAAAPEIVMDLINTRSRSAEMVAPDRGAAGASGVAA